MPNINSPEFDEWWKKKLAEKEKAAAQSSDDEEQDEPEKEPKPPRPRVNFNKATKATAKIVPKQVSDGWTMVKNLFLASLFLVMLYLILHNAHVVAQISSWIGQEIIKVTSLGS